jgi:hypothetical protein
VFNNTTLTKVPVSLLVFQCKTTREENKAKLVSLIIQNSTKHIAHTQKERCLNKIETHTFKAKTILLTCDKFANTPISEFQSFNINDNNIEYVLGITGGLMSKVYSLIS